MSDNRALLSAFTGTKYDSGVAIYANAGTLTLTNTGNIYGSIVLNGAKLVFNNSGTFIAGSLVNLGTGTLSLANGSVMTPGGGGFVSSTDLIGNFNEEAGSDYLVSLDLTNAAASTLNVSGTALLGGTIDLDLLSTNAAVPGSHTSASLPRAPA